MPSSVAKRKPGRFAFLFAFAALLFLGVGSCSSQNSSQNAGRTPGAAGGAGRPASVGGSGSVSIGAGGTGVVIPGGGSGAGGPCVPLTCATPSGQYCGVIGDGCGSTLNCGSNCPVGWQCDQATNLCVGGPDCKPTHACTFAGGAYCGKISDGCGHALECSSPCGSVKSGWVCENNVCVGPASVCTAASCDAGGGAKYCGKIGDSCGRAVECPSDCQPGWSCMGNVCVGGPDCKRRTCTSDSGATFCGTIGDDCGGSLNCGDTCAAKQPGWICDPTKSLCVGGPECKPIQCTTPEGGQYCGDIGDGCGNTLRCGNCPGSGTCTSNVCPTLKCDTFCQAQVTCPGTATTSLTGTVYDPAGKIPLYNVIVSVPDAPLSAIPKGASCETCSAAVSGRPITTALTDATGKFTLENVPVGIDFPLVMQVGKWRRQITVAAAEVRQCANAVINDPQRLRLPRNQSEGSIPKIAITAGDADRLQCLFTRMGIDAAEFTNPEGNGAINIYNDNYNRSGTASYAGGAAWPPAIPLWADVNKMMAYDMILMACGGSNGRYDGNQPLVAPDAAGNVPPDTSDNILSDVMKLALVDYVNRGGRAFAEHYHWGWLRSYPPTRDPIRYIPGTAENPASLAPDGRAPFGNVATWVPPSGASLGENHSSSIDQSFPKGVAFANWMRAVGSTAPLGSIVIESDVKETVTSTIAGVSQRWIYDASPAYVHYMTFNAPVGVAPEKQCGRFVFTGVHVSSGLESTTYNDPKTPGFPTNCLKRDLLNQEKALAFMIFDLSSCVIPDTGMPVPPPTVTGGMAPPVPDAPSAPPPPAAPPPPPPPPPPPIIPK